MNKPLEKWLAIYGKDALHFECDAEDIMHALEQCENANPGEPILAAQRMFTSPALPLTSAAKAQLFMDELLDSVETLTGIVEQYNVRTLVDLMYLQASILGNGFIDEQLPESFVGEVVTKLPSAAEWMTYIRFAMDDFVVVLDMSNGEQVQWQGQARDQEHAEQQALSHANQTPHTVVKISKVSMTTPTAQPSDPTQLLVRSLTKQIESGIAQLRRVIDEPVSIRYGRHVELEVRPATDDDRILVGREDWGFTTVNYTTEGVIVDVIPENAIHSVSSQAVGHDELVDPEVVQEPS